MKIGSSLKLAISAQINKPAISKIKIFFVKSL